MQLPGGFSPTNYIKQLVDNKNPLNGSTNYDIFGNLGDQRTLGASTTNTTPYEGSTSYSDGQTWIYSGGSWKPFSRSADDQVPSNTPTGGGGGAARPAVDTQNVALYDQAIGQANAANSRLDGQYNVAVDNVNNSYNSNLDRLISGKNRANQDYTGAKTTSEKDNIKARSDIDFATGQRANALQRLLGSKGAGSSSAARFAAPYAAALEGTQQLGDVNDAYGKNMNALDQNWKRYEEDWNTQRTDLDTQKANNLQSAAVDRDTKRQSLLQNLADLQMKRASAAGGNVTAAAQPYLDQVNQLAGQIDGLGRQYVSKINVSDPNYVAPDLAKYTYQPRGQVGVSPSAQTQAISPYLSLLLKGRKDEQVV